MRLESALLLTAVAIVVAVATLIGSIFLMRVTRRAGPGVRRGHIALAEADVAARRGSIRARTELDRATKSMEHMDRVTASIGDRMEGSITAMRQARADIQHLRGQRLIPAVRLLRVAGIAARVAVLWR